MKKILYTVIVLTVLLFAAAPSILGFSLLNIGHAISVSTALSAKLGCSSYFVSGFSKEQTVTDLASYSPVVNMVTMEYQGSSKLHGFKQEELKQDEFSQYQFSQYESNQDETQWDSPKRVTADLFGIAKTSATYREGLGCTIDTDTTAELDSISVQNIENPELEDWPLGDQASYDAPFIQETLDSMVRADNEKGYNTRAMLVIKDGHILAESYGPNITKNTPLLGWSMAKSLTAIMVGHLEFINAIKPNPTNLFSQWQNDDRSKLTLQQLLQMSSGLKFDETYAPGSDATRMLFTAPSASDIAIVSPLMHQAGAEFSYSSGTANLLSRFIHEKLGNDSQLSVNYLFEQIFNPLGMANSIFEMDSTGTFVGSSYLYSSGRDWARLGLLMLNQGEINGQRLLSKDWVKRATTPNLSDNDKRYGYQFWLNSAGNTTNTKTNNKLRWPELPNDAYAMMGNRQQSVMIIPSSNLVFVRLGWTAGDYPMASNYSALLDITH
jgi:CubicO group peptidase (beta-lactamase class C family)